MPTPAYTPIHLKSILDLTSLSNRTPGEVFQFGPITTRQIHNQVNSIPQEIYGPSPNTIQLRANQMIQAILEDYGFSPSQPVLISGYISGHSETSSIPFISITEIRQCETPSEPKPCPKLDCMTGLPLSDEPMPSPEPPAKPEPDRKAQQSFIAAQLANLLTQTMSPAERIAILSRLLADAICEDAATCSHSAPQYLSELKANLADAERLIREHLGLADPR